MANPHWMPIVPSVPLKARRSRSAPRAPPKRSAPSQESPLASLRRHIKVSLGATVASAATAARASATAASSLKPSSAPIDTKRIRRDCLGTLVSELCNAYRSSDSWEAFVNRFRGRSYLSPDLQDQDHPAVELLRQWRDQGVPVDTSSPPWTLEQKDRCVERGCHPSATLHSSFLRDEMADFIDSKFWVVLPYTLVRHHQNLMFSPTAVKEERERRPRVLGDHSWPWEWHSVNETTLPHAPPEAMQFGGTLPRLLFHTRHANPRHGAVKANKQDFSDGFY